MRIILSSLTEIISKIDPNYAFVYDFKETFFIFVPLTEEQIKLFNFIYEEFKKDWIYSFFSSYNPIYFPSLREFQEAIDICREIFPRFFEDVKKYPDYPLDGVYPLLKKMQ